MNKSIRRWPGIVFLLSGLTATAFAHPMGNFSINHYAKIKIDRGSVEIRYLIDMAEIPTFQEIRQFDITPAAGDPSASRYITKQEQVLKEGIALQSDGHAVWLNSVSRQLTFADGAGGLPTMKLGFLFRGKLDNAACAHQLSYLDNNFLGRAGWKEIVVRGEGVALLSSSASAIDRSQELTNYSSDALNSPPQQLASLVGFSTPRAAVARIIPHRTKIAPPASRLEKQSSSFIATPKPVAARPQNTPRSRFTELISTQGQLSFWVLFSAALIAAGLGALHALEPGHGKTVVAAYLVGSRGTARHAVLLGVVVTAAHTAGVFLLGALTLYASRYIVPEQLYPWLGAISGLSVAGLGVFIFLRHLTGESGEHSHAPGEQHSHWFLSMFKRTSAAQGVNGTAISDGVEPVEPALSLRELCMLGITGGIVPCPAALVVLLSAFSLHRIGFGLFLITAFSLGLAAVLVIVGLTMVYAKRVMSSRVRAGNAAARFLPFLSSAFMVVLGVGITASAVASVHIWRGLVSTDN